MSAIWPLSWSFAASLRRHGPTADAVRSDDGRTASWHPLARKVLALVARWLARSGPDRTPWTAIDEAELSEAGRRARRDALNAAREQERRARTAVRPKMRGGR